MYPESFREEKLLIEKRDGKIKKQLETKRVRKWISLKVTIITIGLVLQRDLHISHLLKEKKKTYHRKTLSSLTRINAKRHYHERKS